MSSNVLEEGGAKRSLLIVEDNPGTRLLLEYMLKSKYEVAAVSSVDEAIKMAETAAFDGLLLDINLGEKRTGVDLLHALRRLPAYRDVPAVACTAYVMDGDRERLLAEGFGAYVGKPFTKEELHRALERVFNAPGEAATKG